MDFQQVTQGRMACLGIADPRTFILPGMADDEGLDLLFLGAITKLIEYDTDGFHLNGEVFGKDLAGAADAISRSLEHRRHISGHVLSLFEHSSGLQSALAEAESARAKETFSTPRARKSAGRALSSESEDE
jgi:hypothetical protein